MPFGRLTLGLGLGGGYRPPVSGTAPVNTALPAITGTPTSGQTLTVSNGTWTGDAPITYAYQWKADGTAISGATGSTYTLTDTEIGTVITCTVTATNAAGSASATSAATDAVAAATATDPYFASVVLLLPFDGDILDKSGKGHVLTAVGGAVVGTTNPPSFQSQSAGFDGQNDYFSIPDSDDFFFGTGDFTVEGAMRHSDPITDQVFGQYTGGGSDRGWGFFDDGDGSIQFFHSPTGSSDTLLASYNHGTKLSTWVHYAFSRVGNTGYLVYYGAIRATADLTGVTFRNSGLALFIGANGGVSAFYTGRMAQIRITKGVGRYSGAVNDAVSVTMPFPTS